ncbi:MAG: sugar kinase [Firmicutes bacterium HGW-Firmicutes-14]|nr:MAG: sugar kinase [Firmicutes bacterium HGW-Firmicutes-14]
MLAVIGTVPMPEGIYEGEASFEGSSIKLNGVLLPAGMGTMASAAAALRVLQHFGSERVYCLLAGDRSGQGSSMLLEKAVHYLPCSGSDTIVLHYMFVLIKYGEVIRNTLDKMKSKPYLIADAGGMYLAKAAGIAGVFDLFTPDSGEMAFLADPKALHPMYTSPRFFSLPIPDLAESALKHGNAPDNLLVKGRTDFIFAGGKLNKTVGSPVITAMEVIGGTGDTVTGIVAALQHLGIKDFSYKAALLNRLTGQKTGCTPRTRIGEFIGNLDPALLEKAGVEV